VAPSRSRDRSDLGVLALGIGPRRGFSLGVQAYARRSRDLLLVGPVEGEPFATTGAFAAGSAASYGLSTDASWSTKRWGWTARYSFQNTRVQSAGLSYAPENAGRHVLEGAAIVFPTRTASIRASMATALGRRATAIANDFEWESTNILDRGSEFGGSPVYAPDALGASPLPGYYRLDLSIRKEWRLGVAGRDVTLALFGTATNVLGRRNLLTYAPDADTGRTTGVEMRPRAPLVVGLDWGF